MSRQKSHKINKLLASWPNGVIATTKWLAEQGYSRQLLKKYHSGKWIKSIGHGAYSKLGDEPAWAGGLHAIQTQLKRPIHVGGLSALELHGLAHYLKFNVQNQPVYLYNTTNKRTSLPQWFYTAYSHNIKIHFIQRHLFTNKTKMCKRVIDGIELTIATAEQALLEMLEVTPNKVTFEHAAHLVEGAQLLRPQMLQDLLECCNSIKVKRLFLYLADYCKLPCLSHLNLDQIELGHGNRVIGDGGHYVAKYKLSVPVLKTAENEQEIGDV